MPDPSFSKTHSDPKTSQVQRFWVQGGRTLSVFVKKVFFKEDGEPKKKRRRRQRKKPKDITGIS